VRAFVYERRPCEFTQFAMEPGTLERLLVEGDLRVFELQDELEDTSVLCFRGQRVRVGEASEAPNEWYGRKGAESSKAEDGLARNAIPRRWSMLRRVRHSVYR
jgi:hypothetical protein